MSCLCGDTQCWSCGPAQGNEKCSACGEWSDDHACHVESFEVEMQDRTGGPWEYDASYLTRADAEAEVARWIGEGSPVDEIRIVHYPPDPGCKHDDARCAEESKQQAEAEAEQERLMDQYAEDYEKARESWAPPIVVTLTCSKERVDESTVRIDNVEEDMTGRDVVSFDCPKCGERHRSLRLG